MGFGHSGPLQLLIGKQEQQFVFSIVRAGADLAIKEGAVGGTLVAHHQWQRAFCPGAKHCDLLLLVKFLCEPEQEVLLHTVFVHNLIDLLEDKPRQRIGER